MHYYINTVLSEICVLKGLMMKKIGLLALKNCMKSSITGPYDILSVASIEWRRLNPDVKTDLFELKIVSPDGLQVECFGGQTLKPDLAMKSCTNLDLVFIPVVYGDLASLLSDTSLILWLTEQSRKGTMICAVCAGSFLAAQTGLLNHRSATTHWYLADEFQHRYPKVVLKKEKMIVDEGDFITAGGVTAYMDLSLYLTARFGSAELASSLSKALLIDPSRRFQTPYTLFDFNTTHSDKTILSVQAWMKDNLSRHMTIPFLAAKAGFGERTFARRFKKATGDTPLGYLQNLRIGKAKYMLEQTQEPVDIITYATGYEDVSSFRRLFKRITGLSPTAYRKKFSLIH